MNVTPLQTPKVPRLQFIHAGVKRTLNKHSEVQKAVRAGGLALADARFKPWYLRATLPGTSERTYLLSCNDKDAIRGAKDILNGAVDSPSDFAAYIAARDAKRGVTFGMLAKDWLAAGLPFSKTKPRETAAADRLRATLERGLPWWASRTVAATNHDTIEDFVVWRRAHTNQLRGDGNRSADLQLAALSCLCQWAVFTNRIAANPFGERQKFQLREDIEHCSDFMPDNDEQLHAVMSWFFVEPENIARVLAGGTLAMCALSGLRPGEPRLLNYHAQALAEFPADLDRISPGEVYPLPDGGLRMAVARTKGGQNPHIIISPVLADFLATWKDWHKDHVITGGASRPLFPAKHDFIANQLDRAVVQVKSRKLTPHGFRAYYVRVRRSQGLDDAAIAGELGHTSNGKLIWNVYGAPKDPRGGSLHDWQPKNGQLAWSLLKLERANNVVAL